KRSIRITHYAINKGSNYGENLETLTDLQSRPQIYTDDHRFYHIFDAICDHLWIFEEIKKV
ncbi:MAG: hypothetical protein KDJ65_12240, partial [Anaerolineae bacterium]|nr:hypothetical protein [Anaerolineae bacterium]